VREGCGERVVGPRAGHRGGDAAEQAKMGASTDAADPAGVAHIAALGDTAAEASDPTEAARQVEDGAER
jgi:hypothetical protein